MWFRFGWHRSRQTWIASLVLLAMLFRAAIPAGFMPMPGASGWPTLELCPGTVSVHRGMNDALGAHPTHHHGTSQTHNHSPASGVDPDHGSPAPGHDHVPCLFAAGAGAAPLPSALDAPSAAVEPLPANSEVTESVFTPSIVRAQSPRAPPIPRNA